MRTFDRFGKQETGQSLVEFALILPVFLLLVLGMLEYGWILNAQLTVSSASKEVARMAIVEDAADYGDAVSYGRSLLQEAGNYVASTISVSVNTAAGDKELEATVSAKVSPLIGFYIKDPVTLSSNTVMRKE